jgi:dTDP-glucose pyrophosphorylase
MPLQENYMDPSKLASVVIAADDPMQTAIQRIDHSGLKIAIVLDDAGGLLGIVTDGDIRRALLAGHDLSVPVATFMNKTPRTARKGTEAADLLERLRNEQILHLPIVTADGKFHDLAYLPALEAPHHLENDVVIMAGGLGSRLRPLTDKIPKPLVSVGGRPLIDTIVDGLVSQGLTRITLCLNYLGEMLEEHLGDGSRYGATFTFVHEEKRLGTAGALSLLPTRPSRPFYVLNGDILTTVDFVSMHEFHRQVGSKATMGVNNFHYEVPYGVVEVDDWRITGLSEKPRYSYRVNAGIYLLDPEILDLVPRDEFFDMTSLFDRIIEAGLDSAAFPVRENWLDVGRPEDLKRANQTMDEFSVSSQDDPR